MEQIDISVFDDRSGWGNQYTPRQMLKTALIHARPLIEGDEAAPVSAEDLALAGAALDATMTISEDQLHALARIAGLGAEYMRNNNYADDEGFPEDAAAASWLSSGDSAEEWVYFLLGYRPTYRVAGQDFISDLEAKVVADETGVNVVDVMYLSRVYYRLVKVTTARKSHGITYQWKRMPAA
jgi:hypothetical protein